LFLYKVLHSKILDSSSEDELVHSCQKLNYDTLSESDDDSYDSNSFKQNYNDKRENCAISSTYLVCYLLKNVFQRIIFRLTQN
jgi:hypothetical protein